MTRLRSGVKSLFQGSPFKTLFFAYGMVESIFYLWFLHARSRVQKPQKLKAADDYHDRWKLFDRLKATDNNRPPYSFFREWVEPTPVEKVGREDVKRWLSWAFFDTTLEEVILCGNSSELELMANNLENGLGIKFPAGSTGVPLILLNLDPVVAIHRPFVHYVATTCLGLVSKFNLMLRRFSRHRQDFITYWIRAGDDSTLDPVIFIHGVGIGLATYLPFRKIA